MYITETHSQVRDMTRQFANEVIRPVAEELDREERFPAEIYSQMAELGLFGISVPEAMGGPGFDTVTYALVMEELSRGFHLHAPGASYPTMRPVAHLDRFAFSHDLELTGSGVHATELARIASDHLPVWAEFQLEEK